MAWAHIQRAEEATWEDYERVAKALGDGPVDGLLTHVAGEVDGRWIAVSTWESKEAYERFIETRLRPAVVQALGEEFAAAGPPPDEWFEVKHSLAS
jgi:hypothetical protein